MTKVLSPLLLFSILASSSLAQEAPQPPPPKTGPAGSGTGAGPSTVTFAGIAAPGVQLVMNAEREDKMGTVALDWGTGTTQMRLSLSSPLNTSQETSPATLTGLSSGAEFRYALSSFSNPGPNPVERRDLELLCKKLIEAHNSEATPPHPLKTLEDCDRAYVFERGGIDELSLFDFYQGLHEPIWLRGVEVGVSQAKYAFLLPVTLESQSENHGNVGFTARIGRYTVPTGFVIGSLTGTRNYEPAGRSENLCRRLENVDDETATTCISAIRGKPILTEGLVGTLEIRKFFSEYKAITPSVSYGRQRTKDGEWKGVWSVDVPMYFIEGPGGTLGGIRFGWRSNKKEVTASLFVGAAIGLLR